MLGWADEQLPKERVKFMEDCDSDKYNREKWMFKAVDIDLETFRVLVRKSFGARQ